ncbi:emp24/gp25L/p24 family/GOLD-domain-containing protein [Tribonema minus]|uniref:Emp24/gp25L/p24 family/GOLD-domain-containing protein n=1 Tax=Tribonema minus TaxID=303371 RepID=A0A835Z684_9STRA|nr:emp24/gp25L/p24 family/GOLD-domain-containing protein [Tribonema minus]
MRRAVLLAAAAAAVSSIHALQLDVQPGDTRCLGEELGEDTPAKFVFKQAPRNNKPLDFNSKGVYVMVTDPSGKSIFKQMLRGEQDVEFQYTSEGPGLYHICFSSSAHSIQRVDLSVGRHYDSESFVKSIKEEALQPLELLLSRAEDAARAINAEMDLSIQRESELKYTSVNMEWRINAFALFSIVVLLGLSAWQIVFLKKFFRSKKLL